MCVMTATHKFHIVIEPIPKGNRFFQGSRSVKSFCLHSENVIRVVFPVKTGASLPKPVSWLRRYKTFFMLNSAEHEICSANKSQITNN